MSKKHADNVCPLYARESSLFSQSNKRRRYDPTETNRESRTENYNECGCSSEITKRDVLNKCDNERYRNYLHSGGSRITPNSEHSIDELIDSNTLSDESSSKIHTYSQFQQSDESILRHKIGSVYYRLLYHEEFPVKEKRQDLSSDVNFSCTRPTFPAKSASTSNRNSLEERMKKYKQLKTITPSKYKKNHKETNMDRKCTYSTECFRFKPASDYVPHVYFKWPYQKTPEMYDPLAVLPCQNHGEPVETDFERCGLEKQDFFVPSQTSETGRDSWEEICVEISKSDEKNVRWVTSLMASTHYPCRWLGAMIRDFIIYLFFLLCLVIVVFSRTDPALYYYCHSVYELILKTPYEVEASDSLKITKTFSAMNSVTDQWSFIRTVFVPNVYISQIIGTKVKSSEMNMEMLESVLIGVPRMRQVRVKPDECLVQPELKNIFKVCFDYYSPLTEDNLAFGSKEDNGWKYLQDSNDRTYFGKISNYHSGGYSYNFSSDVDQTKAKVDQLHNNSWIDRATRAVFLDFTFYTPNINFFHVIKLAMEMPPSGGVLPSSHCYSMKFIRYVSYYDFFICGLEIFLIGFVIYFTAQLIREVMFYGRTYILLFWGVYEILLLMIAYVYILLWISVTIISYTEIVELLKSSLVDSNYYPNFNYIAQINTIYNMFAGVFIFTAFLKVFRFFMISKTYYYFSSTLFDCALQLLGHLVLLIIVILSFAILGHLLFGSQVLDFSSSGWSFFTLFIMILGGFNYEQLLSSNFIMAPVFIFTFVVIVLFLFVNFFVAIVVHAYLTALCNKNETDCCRLYLGEAISRYIKNLDATDTKKNVNAYSETVNRTNKSNSKVNVPSKIAQCYSANVDPFILSNSGTSLKCHSSRTMKLNTEKTNSTEVQRVLAAKNQDQELTGEDREDVRQYNSQLKLIKNKIEYLDTSIDLLIQKMRVMKKENI